MGKMSGEVKPSSSCPGESLVAQKPSDKQVQPEAPPIESQDMTHGQQRGG
jgi:hypothetical protein